VFLIVKEPVARPAVLRGPHVQAFLEHDVSLLFSVVLIPSSLAAVSDFFEAVFSGNGEGRLGEIWALRLQRVTARGDRDEQMQEHGLR
jgi:hypothetical protein